MQSSLHSHDVTVWWNFWPFNHLFWVFPRNFMNGFMFNWVNNFLNDLWFFPRQIWNFVFEVAAWPLNIILDVLNFLPNFIFGIPNFIMSVLGIFPGAFRYSIWWLPVFLLECFVIGIPVILWETIVWSTITAVGTVYLEAASVEGLPWLVQDVYTPEGQGSA